jgi:tripartite-type tricarboxylate transporter receptor subunit TctC
MGSVSFNLFFLEVLAVVTDKRAEFAPNVPTVVELGYPLVYIPLLPGP